MTIKNQQVIAMKLPSGDAAALKLARVCTLSEDEHSSTIDFFTCNAPVKLKLFRPAPDIHYADDAGPGPGEHARWQASATAALGQARDACVRFEGLFSRFLPDSDISRINRASGALCSVAPETYDVLQAALAYCAASEGTFDVTIAPASALWDFSTGRRADADALRRACRHVDWRTVECQRVGIAERESGDSPPHARPLKTLRTPAGAPCRVRLNDPEAALDLGGIAKGWIADRLGAGFRSAGFDNFLINLGGTVLVAGPPPVQAEAPDRRCWKIGIRNPEHRTSMAGFLRLDQGAVVTSGTYERAFEVDGVRYHHILDPRTGLPVDTDVVSATVVADRALDAEGFSTTLVALGIERALDFAERQPAIRQAILIDRRARFHCSSPR